MKKEEKNSGFKIPEGYFEGFTDNLLNSLAEKDTSLPGDDGFALPKGYFDSLHERIRLRMDADRTKVIPLNRYRAYYMAAASIAAVILLIIGLRWQIDEAPTFEDLAGSDIDTYLEHKELDLTDYEIAQLLPVGELEVQDLIESNIQEEYILEYLDGSIEDYEDLNMDFND